MPAFYPFHCPACGWRGHRYRNVKKCPQCREPAEREQTMPEDLRHTGATTTQTDQVIVKADTPGKDSGGTPLAILAQAVERGMPAEAVKTLSELAERWEDRRAAQAYSDALALCQAQLPAILKDAENSHTQKRYETLEAVNRAIVPVTTQHGFSISFGTEDSKLERHIRIVADVRHRGGHKERYCLDVPLDGEGAKGGKSSMNSTQATGSTISYGRRYLKRMIFDLSTTDDNDGVGRSATITAEDIAAIEDLFAQLKTAGRLQDVSKIIRWAADNDEATELAQVPLRRCDLLVSELRKRLKEARAPKEAKP